MNLKYISIFAVGLTAFSYFFFMKKMDTNKSGIKTNDEIIVVGTSADYPPFTNIDLKTSEIVGFDIDVVNEVARRLGKKIKIKDIPLAGLIFSLMSGDVEIIAAGISPSEKKARTVSFSTQYIQPEPFVIVSKKSDKFIKNLDDLAGKRVSVNSGYTAEAYLSDKEGIDLVRLATPAESIMALKSGAVDAYVCVQSVINLMLGKNDQLQDFATAVIENTGDGCALVVNKNNIQLLKDINIVLDAMEQDGTLAALRRKWNLK